MSPKALSPNTQCVKGGLLPGSSAVNPPPLAASGTEAAGEQRQAEADDDASAQPNAEAVGGGSVAERVPGAACTCLPLRCRARTCLRLAVRDAAASRMGLVTCPGSDLHAQLDPTRRSCADMRQAAQQAAELQRCREECAAAVQRAEQSEKMVEKSKRVMEDLALENSERAAELEQVRACAGFRSAFGVRGRGTAAT